MDWQPAEHLQAKPFTNSLNLSVLDNTLSNGEMALVRPSLYLQLKPTERG